jgi:hypothetical protein
MSRRRYAAVPDPHASHSEASGAGDWDDWGDGTSYFNQTNLTHPNGPSDYMDPHPAQSGPSHFEEATWSNEYSSYGATDQNGATPAF